LKDPKLPPLSAPAYRVRDADRCGHAQAGGLSFDILPSRSQHGFRHASTHPTDRWRSQAIQERDCHGALPLAMTT